jgi:hypothetical protein
MVWHLATANLVLLFGVQRPERALLVRVGAVLQACFDEAHRIHHARQAEGLLQAL